MVGLGFLMFGLGLLSLLARWRGVLFTSRWLHRFARGDGPRLAWLPMLCGWVTTEMGRQPYTVYGQLAHHRQRVADRAGRGCHLAGGCSPWSYFIVFGAGIMIILRLMSRPPVPGESGPNTSKPTRARRHPSRAARRGATRHRPKAALCRRSSGDERRDHRHHLGPA